MYAAQHFTQFKTGSLNSTINYSKRCGNQFGSIYRAGIRGVHLLISISAVRKSLTSHSATGQHFKISREHIFIQKVIFLLSTT